MAGDYTRFTFDPTKGFSGVLKQQGRVSLDSGANEFEEILDRRDRAEMYDTVGPAVYPMTTPDAFKIGVSGGKLTIGQGRLYVDGILAECFGDMSDPDPSKTDFDAHMNDLVGKLPLFYDQQPFFYTVPPFPALAPAAGTVNLVYLDVWQREVTVFEDYALREIALNGPDTDTRMQTAWQVKAIDASGATSCTAPVAAWDALIAPSTARLTATATPTAPAPGPCVIAPAGGYTGLENRLYRIEVHQGGPIDGAGTKAKFKWSRDNASLAARVLSTTKIAPTDWIITVASTGRDSWMRFEFGDHIELLDDNVEFAMRETNVGGIMAKVTNVNHATGEIRVDTDLTALPIIASRHPRIRRWDFASAVEPLVRDTNNGVAIALENGITITFGTTAADTLHAGDHWVFAARTADGSIDTLVTQPPRNILHHFVRLALVTSGAPPVVITDCRIPWPPPWSTTTAHEGCCSQVVEVGEDIQAAIDKLFGIGGCVCLKMGVHHIVQPLQIKQSNITLHGEVPWVTVQLDRGGPNMLNIAPTENVRIEGILFIAEDGRAHEPMISVSGAIRSHIGNCGLRIGTENPDPTFQAIGIQIVRSDHCCIENDEILNFPFGVEGIECSDISVLANQLQGPHFDLGAARVSLGQMGVLFEGSDLSGLYIEKNSLDDYVRGIQLGDVSAGAIMPSGGAGKPVDVSGTVEGCRIAANRIKRALEPPPKAGDPPLIAFAIATHVARCEIDENTTNIDTLQQYGILVAGGNGSIQRNEIRSHVEFDPSKPLDHLPIGVCIVETQSDALICVVRGNLFTGVQQAVVATGAGTGSAHRVDILENRVEGVESLLSAAIAGKLLPGGANPIGNLLSMIERFGAIVVGELGHCRIADNEIQHAVCGVACVGTLGASVTGNRVNSSLAGVIIMAAAECEADDNVIDASFENAPTLGVGFFLVVRSLIARNAIGHCAEGVLTVLCNSVRAQDNDIYETQFGIGSLIDIDLALRGNNIEDAAQTGISVMFSMHELTLAHDRALRCGYRGPGAFSPSEAVGIEVVLSLALVTIEGCHVIDTGESADPTAPVFIAPRYGIRVLWALGVRIRGCEVATHPLVDNATNLPIGVNANSRAVRMWTLSRTDAFNTLGSTGRLMIPFADATDNVIEESEPVAVEIIAPEGEILFASNRCIRFFGTDMSPVWLIGENVVATGNRIRNDDGAPSLAIVFLHGLSAVGNMTSNPALAGPGAVDTPAPYTAFNAQA